MRTNPTNANDRVRARETKGEAHEVLLASRTCKRLVQCAMSCPTSFDVCKRVLADMHVPFRFGPCIVTPSLASRSSHAITWRVQWIGARLAFSRGAPGSLSLGQSPGET